MKAEPMPHILALNGGSSSIRFALYEESDPLRRLDGKVDTDEEQMIAQSTCRVIGFGDARL